MVCARCLVLVLYHGNRFLAQGGKGSNITHNFAFEADAVSQRTVSCYRGGPRGSTRR